MSYSQNKHSGLIKVVFVLPSLTAGGAERVLINLMNGLDKTRFAPSIITVNNGGDLHDLIGREIPYKSLHRDSVFKSTPALYKVLKHERPNIIVSTMAHMNFAVMALKPFFPDTKFVIREAITPSFFFEKYKNRSFIIKNLYKRYYPKADVLLSPASTILDEFTASLSLDDDNFMVLPNSVDINKMRSQDNFQPISTARKTRVDYVACGRLGKQKGFDRLINMLPKLNHTHDWRLTIYGEGAERENLESLINSLGLNEQVYLPGLVKEPYTQFAQADCFLLPSLFEGLPNVILETLACGTPAIATKESGGIHEIAKHTAPDALNVVQNMDKFITQMREVRPDPVQSFRKSLLPDVYHKQAVVSRFNGLLLSLVGQEERLKKAA
ncbi:MAG: glycosyltransferase [Alphaproteobacteria bacterium]